MPKMLDAILPVLSTWRYWASTLGTVELQVYFIFGYLDRLESCLKGISRAPLKWFGDDSR